MADASPIQEKRAAPAGVPQYVLDYAPIVYLHSQEKYFPSDIAAQVANTVPKVNFTSLPSPPAPNPLTLDNLDQLNPLRGSPDVWLTSKVDITTNPAWLEGVKPDAAGKLGDAIASTVIVNDKGNGDVDAFYMHFYAFNWGGVVLGQQLGDHIGDWEHNMVRFKNGQPQSMWYSQHANGQAFKYAAVNKYQNGQRPIAYSANGSHALYADSGTHEHTIPNLVLPIDGLLNDHTDNGFLWDPLLSAWYYKYDAGTSTFTPYDASYPVAWLNYKGRWGDEQYPDSDKRQKKFFGQPKYGGGPTGPGDKQLNRTNVCPSNGIECIVRDNLGPLPKEKEKRCREGCTGCCEVM